MPRESKSRPKSFTTRLRRGCSRGGPEIHSRLAKEITSKSLRNHFEIRGASSQSRNAQEAESNFCMSPCPASRSPGPSPLPLGHDGATRLVSSQSALTQRGFESDSNPKSSSLEAPMATPPTRTSANAQQQLSGEFACSSEGVWWLFDSMPQQDAGSNRRTHVYRLFRHQRRKRRRDGCVG